MTKNEILVELDNVLDDQNKTVRHIISILIICIYSNLVPTLIELTLPFLFDLTSPKKENKLKSIIPPEEQNLVVLLERIGKKCNVEAIEIIFTAFVIALKIGKTSDFRNELIKIAPYIENSNQINFYSDISSKGKTLQ